MPSKIERLVSFIAAVLSIGQIGWVVYGQFESMSIPLWLYLSSVITALIAGFGISRWAFRKSKMDGQEAFKEIGRVTFDYLPDPPANHGWILHLDGENGSHPVFSAVQDCPTSGGIKIIKKDRYALDYSVNQIQSLANMVELYANFEQEACFYLKVKLSSRDGSKVQDGWLAHIIGQGPLSKAPVKSGRCQCKGTF